MDEDAPYASPHKNFGTPTKKSVDSSGEENTADGKKLSSSSSNSLNNQRNYLVGEEEETRKTGCISSPRDVTALFFGLMLGGIILFVAVPTVSILSLYPLYYQLNSLVPSEVQQYIAYFTLVMNVDESDILMDYYTYLGNTDLATKYMDMLEDSTTETIVLLNKFCSVMDSCEEADAITLNTSFNTLKSTTFPNFQTEVAGRIETLKGFTEQSTLRDTLFNALVTESDQAKMARGPYMIASAKLECYAITSCWESTDAQQFFSDVETAVGNLVGSASAAIIDIFAVIEDPRFGQTVASDVIDMNNQRNTDRTALIDTFDAALTAATAIINEVQDGGSVSTGLAPLFFVLPPNWANSLVTTLTDVITYTKAVNDLFIADFGVTSAATNGVEDALTLNVSEAEVMSLAQSLQSYFSYDIGTGLTMSISQEEQDSIYYAFNHTIAEYIMNLRQQVEKLYAPTYSSLGNLVYTEDKTMEQRSILEMSIITMVLATLGSFAFYLGALIVVRNYLPESPFPFIGLLIVVSCMFVLQVSISAIIVWKVSGTPMDARSFTYEFLQDLNSQCQDIANTASMITRKVVKSGLLISPDYDSVQKSFDSFSAILVKLSAEYAEKSWYNYFFTMSQIIQNLMAAGFYPVRQAFTTASSLNFTSTALMTTFGITGVDGGPATAPEACNLLTGASVLTQLNSNYFSLSAVRERLALGKVMLDQNSFASEFSSATMQTSCLLSYVLYEDSQETCFDATTCSAPATYGMLRSTSETDSIYSVFDPFSETALGSLLSNVKQLRLGLYDDINNLFEEVRSASDSDCQTVELTRRLLIWMSVFTFLVLFGTLLALRMLLFGHSLFSMFA